MRDLIRRTHQLEVYRSDYYQKYMADEVNSVTLALPTNGQAQLNYRFPTGRTVANQL